MTGRIKLAEVLQSAGVLLFLHQIQNLDWKDGTGEIMVKKVGYIVMRASPPAEKDLGKPVIAKKKDNSTTSEGLRPPCTVP